MNSGSRADSAKTCSGKCSVCGKRVQPESQQCSVSCALAARIPLGSSNLPASWELSGALISGFLLFNQQLFWFMAWAKRAQGDETMSGRFDLASLIAGFAWLLAAIVAWGIARPKRPADSLGPLAGIAVVWLGVSLIGWPQVLPSQLAIFNLLVAIQLYRGIAFLYLASKKREK